MQPQPQPSLQPSLRVSNPYVFKCRLKRYAQKLGYPTPVYQNTMEGPSHKALFKSTVIVNNVRYESLPGFQNRILAEQSASKVALIELAKSEDSKAVIHVPVHETGLCKNLLQDYVQKMNYAVPTYAWKKDEISGKTHFSCIVEVGGIWYIGATAETKKEAELKAARTVLLAIQTSPSQMVEKPNEETVYTVLPCKRKEPEPVTPKEEVVKTRKAKKSHVKKNPFNMEHRVAGDGAIQAGNVDAVNTDLGPEAINLQSANTNLGTEVMTVPSVNPNLGTEVMTVPSVNPNLGTEVMTHIVYTKEPEPVTPKEEVVKTRKAKKSRVKKNPFNKELRVAGDGAIQAGNVDAVNTDLGPEAINIQSANMNLGTEVLTVPSANMNLGTEVLTVPSVNPNLGTEVMTVPSVNPNLGTEVMTHTVPSVNPNLGTDVMTVPSVNLNLGTEVMTHTVPSGDLFRMQ